MVTEISTSLGLIVPIAEYRIVVGVLPPSLIPLKKISFFCVLIIIGF